MDATERKSTIHHPLIVHDVNNVLTDVIQGLVTSAQKLNRKGILEKYQKEVDKAYSKS